MNLIKSFAEGKIVFRRRDIGQFGKGFQQIWDEIFRAGPLLLLHNRMVWWWLVRKCFRGGLAARLHTPPIFIAAADDTCVKQLPRQ